MSQPWLLKQYTVKLHASKHRLCVLQDTLRIWAELGAKDPEQLKELLVKRSMAPLTALAIQSVLDFVACGGQQPACMQA
jgi:predicted short-subunit dehydrogenase-like oxidoreductase (DUF2520 family)